MPTSFVGAIDAIFQTQPEKYIFSQVCRDFSKKLLSHCTAVFSSLLASIFITSIACQGEGAFSRQLEWLCLTTSTLKEKIFLIWSDQGKRSKFIHLIVWHEFLKWSINAFCVGRKEINIYYLLSACQCAFRSDIFVMSVCDQRRSSHLKVKPLSASPIALRHLKFHRHQQVLFSSNGCSLHCPGENQPLHI